MALARFRQHSPAIRELLLLLHDSRSECLDMVNYFENEEAAADTAKKRMHLKLQTFDDMHLTGNAIIIPTVASWKETLVLLRREVLFVLDK